MIPCSLRGTAQRVLLVTALALGGGLAARPAVAQSADERAGARAAAMEGSKALNEGRWADAIDLFSRAESLVHAPPHLLYMARAQIGAGLLVEARENLLALSRENLAADAPKAFQNAQAEARKELSELEPRISYVNVNTKGAEAAASVAVLQDGKRIPAALVGVPRPVNPGSHTFEAIAEGLKGTASIEIKEGERQRVIIELHPAQVSAPPADAAGTTESGATATTEASADTAVPAESGGTNMLRIGSYIGFGVGALGLASGVIFSLQAKSKSDESDQLHVDNDCTNTGCPAQRSEIEQLTEDAKSAKTLGLVGFIVGGVGVAAGVTLFILSSDSGSEEARATTPHVRLVAAPSSLYLQGAF